MPHKAIGQFGYTKREETLNFYTHITGLAAAVFGSFAMMQRAVDIGGFSAIFGSALFCSTFIAVFASSSLYHGLPNGRLKYSAKKLDHISIYLIIGGIYTALVLAAAQNILGFAVVVCVWSLCILGTWEKCRNCPQGETPNSLPLYIIMSSLVIPLLPFLNWNTIAFLMGAAVLNIAGLIFYSKKGKEYMHAVWHAFSFAAAACDYFAVFYAFGFQK